MIDIDFPTMSSITEIMGFDPTASSETYNMASALSDMVSKCQRGELCAEDVVSLFDHGGIPGLFEAISMLLVTLAAAEEVSGQMASFIKEVHGES